MQSTRNLKKHDINLPLSLFCASKEEKAITFLGDQCPTNSLVKVTDENEGVYKKKHLLPRIVKIVINRGIGSKISNNTTFSTSKNTISKNKKINKSSNNGVKGKSGQKKPLNSRIAGSGAMNSQNIKQYPKTVETALKELSLIAGQKGIITRSKKAIAGFKLRESTPVGVVVTLRGNRMYSFLERLIHLALPRVKDFKGLSPLSFDKNGNFSIGLPEQLIFEEVEYDKIEEIRGMNVTIVTTAKNKEEGYALLKEFGLPFN
uniref:Large ribosomal subunit protein uL5c n=1 Tax=Volvocales sp. NrCl902 TaxID=2682054 RepID=A0A7G1GGA1_9CHLO|nr:ribosomal protein L5 [Volvocales sp. NrCl902]